VPGRAWELDTERYGGDIEKKKKEKIDYHNNNRTQPLNKMERTTAGVQFCSHREKKLREISTQLLRSQKGGNHPKKKSGGKNRKKSITR